uniref:Late embryogenesis abundant protein n=1 Tax=Peronospora matthiolae TaxID=2874970 RepID=A0AAV1TV54_9STRA
MQIPTSMPKSSNDRGMKEAASKKVDEMLTEAEQMRDRKDLGDQGRRTLEQIQEDARNLGEYARGKMDHMNEVMREAAASARESAGLPDSAPVPTDAMSEKVMDSLKTASEKLSAEISDLGERVESVRARVAHQVHAAGGKAKDTVNAASDKAKDTVYAASDKAKDTMHAAGDKAKDTWIQSSEAAKNVGEREYCLPLPTDRICARHVAMVGLPLLALFLLMMMRRRYPKKWQASVDKMRTPGKSLAREMPSSDHIKSKLEGVADTLEEKIEYGKQRGSAVVDQVRSKYGQVENKKEQ